MNKVALITGGSSGIGRATALAFAREGARVVIAARGSERAVSTLRELEALGATAKFVQSDVSNAGEVQKLIEETVNCFGGINCTVNNAATADCVLSPTADIADEDFDRLIAADLRSVWLCLKYEIRQMLAQEPIGGAIVNTSSINGLGAAANSSVYSASKAGVLALTKAAAQEYADRGIRVNALVAGYFDTPRLKGSLDRASGGNPATRKSMEDSIRQITPLGRIGRPEEAAEAILWLCSESASYVTGHSMIVDGGATSPFR